MTEFQSVMAAAQQLPEDDRLRLIDSLWDSISPDRDAPLSDEWAIEIERRVAELDAGTAATVPWSTVRSEAIARLS